MNKREHVINGLLVGIGVGILLSPTGELTMARSIVAVAVPVLLGALFPDIDAVIGSHRKTFHNLIVLGIFAAFPYVFDNLQYVWIGVLTHYVLDCFGSKRGIALFYPFPDEWNPLRGVTVSSRFAGAVTGLISLGELLFAYFLILATQPNIPLPPLN